MTMGKSTDREAHELYTENRNMERHIAVLEAATEERMRDLDHVWSYVEELRERLRLNGIAIPEYYDR